jgi:hypothetical protein
MEVLRCKCAKCDSELGHFMNLWTQIGKNYFSPLVAPSDELEAIVANGPSRSGEAGTIIGGWYVQVRKN